MREIREIREQLKERKGWSLADENRDSKLFLAILDELCHHIEILEAAYLKGERGAAPMMRNCSALSATVEKS